tara:strand:+ start:5460 stop:5615 length:156 start_codon:yes stop_codon:yes gene_type:complete
MHRKTTGASFIIGPLKFVRRTAGFAACSAKPQEGFATKGRHKIVMDGFRIP